jgi:predicted  nucleic acid-binding Zn-ribbon protein
MCDMNKNTLVGAGAAVLAAAVLGIGGAAFASADTTSGSASTATTTTQAPAANGTQAAPDPSKPVRSDETLLTGDTAAKVTAAAKAKEPTATIQRVETDSEGVYEAHMVRTDGTQIIVQIDKSFAVTNAGAPGANGQAPSGAPSGSATSGTSANG